jgi:hypothetical protein
MFLGEEFPTFQNDRNSVMFREKQCHIPEGLGQQQLGLNTSVSSQTIVEMLISLSLYGGTYVYLWWLMGLFTCRKLGVNPSTVYVGFMADKVALG